MNDTIGIACEPEQYFDDDTVLWRYMGLSKYLALLQNLSLYLTLIDSFNDAYEGYFPSALNSLFKGSETPVSHLAYGNRMLHYVSCWHENESESEAMWKLYLPANEGVAIKTTRAKLARQCHENYISFPSMKAPFKCKLGKVKYIDYNNTSNFIIFTIMKQSEALSSLFFNKRISFQHENEFRIVSYYPHRQHSSVIPMRIHLEKLIDEVVVAPNAPDFLIRVIDEVSKPAALKVRGSALNVMPTWGISPAEREIAITEVQNLLSDHVSLFPKVNS